MTYFTLVLLGLVLSGHCNKTENNIIGSRSIYVRYPSEKHHELGIEEKSDSFRIPVCISYIHATEALYESE